MFFWNCWLRNRLRLVAYLVLGCALVLLATLPTTMKSVRGHWICVRPATAADAMDVWRFGVEHVALVMIFMLLFAAADLGSLSNEQQHRFRAPLRVPVSLQTAAGLDLNCTASDLSVRGMGLESLTAVLERQSELRVRFQLPDSDVNVEARARLAWGGTHGRAGITFTEVHPAVHQEISRWLRQKMTEAAPLVFQ